jgi:hypothetical protein
MNRALRRKLIYVALMILCAPPLFWLSHPATRATKEAPGRAGGMLAKARDRYHLNQTELGKIDLTSETIKLVTLGLRGVAADVLWWQANQFQMKKDWTNLQATLEQISELQPHSIGVWRFQAWNLSYNVSVAFDDYHDKYHWVIEGIKFLQRGVEINEHQPRLPWDLGWFISHKIGKADEAKLYRRLFKQDDQTESLRPAEFPPPDELDNWLVGKQWFHSAENRITSRHPVTGMMEVIFYSDAPMCQFYYADALEKEGRFGQIAPRAWRQAAAEWHDFGDRAVPNFDRSGTIHLNDQEVHENAARLAGKALNGLVPGARETIAREKLAKLSPAERKAWETPLEKRTSDQFRLANDVAARMSISYDEVARRAPKDQRAEAKRLADEATKREELARYVHRERQNVNFDYWRTRAAAEQTAEAVGARKAVYEAEQALRKGDLLAARAAYERGFQLWRKVLDSFPSLVEDVSTGQDLMDVIRRYHKQCLEKLEGKMPSPFILQDIVDRYKNRQ